jgi:hypothetical protein
VVEMAIRHYRRDPRTTEEKQADEDARLRFIAVLDAFDALGKGRRSA